MCSLAMPLTVVRRPLSPWLGSLHRQAGKLALWGQRRGCMHLQFSWDEFVDETNLSQLISKVSRAEREATTDLAAQLSA